jgi:hypothetical protein
MASTRVWLLTVFVVDDAGDSHTAEIPYVWGIPKLIHNPAVTADSGYASVTPWTQTEIAYSEFIMLLVTNFAKYGLVSGLAVFSRKKR